MSPALSIAGGGGGGKIFLTAVIADGEAVEDKPGVGRVYPRSKDERSVCWTNDHWACVRRARMHTRQVLLPMHVKVLTCLACLEDSSPALFSFLFPSLPF